MAAADPERWVVIDGARRSIAGRRRRRPGRGARARPCATECARPSGTASSGSRRGRAAAAAAADPVHAYLFVGPPGMHQARRRPGPSPPCSSTRRDDPAGRDARLALAGEHPDVREVERVGAAISADQVDEIIRLAALSPGRGRRKVLDPRRVPPARPEGAARLLKTIEEPPPSTVFVVLADDVPLELVTIASRCVRVDFRAIADAARSPRRSSTEGASADTARQRGAGRGRQPRPGPPAGRRPRRGRRGPTPSPASRAASTAPGHAVCLAVDELLGLIDAAADAAEGAPGEGGRRPGAPDGRARRARLRPASGSRSGTGGSCAGTAPTSCKVGLAAVPPATYRDALVEAGVHHPAAAVDAVQDIHQAIEALERNPNEHLLLQALLLRLPSAARADGPATTACDGRWGHRTRPLQLHGRSPR